jgi:hypothetical protein
MSEFTIGQILWREVSPRRGISAFVTVTKVGRRWITVSNDERFDAHTMLEDAGGYKAYASYWNSKEECDESAYRGRVWNELNKSRYGSPPKDSSTEDLILAAKILGVKIPDRNPAPDPNAKEVARSPK